MIVLLLVSFMLVITLGGIHIIDQRSMTRTQRGIRARRKADRDRDLAALRDRADFKRRLRALDEGRRYD